MLVYDEELADGFSVIFTNMNNKVEFRIFGDSRWSITLWAMLTTILFGSMNIELD